MNPALDHLAASLALNAPTHDRLRFAFAHACVLRVAQFIEDPAVADCLLVLGRYLDGTADRPTLDAAAAQASRLANHHPGSRFLDGAGHAAVSATYAVANALAGKALQAADYAAYALVYGQGGYGAVAERESFEPEFRWQVECLRSLAAAQGVEPRTDASRAV